MLNDNQTENLLLKKTKRSEANDIRFEFNWARIDLVSGINVR